MHATGEASSISSGVRRTTAMRAPSALPSTVFSRPAPSAPNGASEDSSRRTARRPAAFIIATFTGVQGSRFVPRAQLWERSCSRPCPACRCEPPPPSERMSALSTRASATAHARTGTGSPCCGDERVASAAWGSQRQHVMPVAQSAPTFRENSGIAQTPADGGGGSHRRSRAERTWALADVATNTSMPRAPAREAG